MLSLSCWDGRRLWWWSHRRPWIPCHLAHLPLNTWGLPVPLSSKEWCRRAGPTVLNNWKLSIPSHSSAKDSSALPAGSNLCCSVSYIQLASQQNTLKECIPNLALLKTERKVQGPWLGKKWLLQTFHRYRVATPSAAPPWLPTLFSPEKAKAPHNF